MNNTKSVLTYLDCGCAIDGSGHTTLCPTCEQKRSDAANRALQAKRTRKLTGSYPAFPAAGVDGMSMRQWYVGMAMQGLLAGYTPDEEPDAEYISKKAVEIADTMLFHESKQAQETAP